MRDALPSGGPKTNASAIVNLDSSQPGGTHWVSYRKVGKRAEYYDSFGNLHPPPEIVRYLGTDTEIIYNHPRHQKFNSYNCGHLCLRFLASHRRTKGLLP